MKSPTTHENGVVAILDALGAAAYGRIEIDRFTTSREIVLRLAREKAEETLDVERMATFTFNDTIVFALNTANGRNECPSMKEVSAFFLLLRKFMIDSLQKGILFRGAIAIGTFYADKGTNTVMGEAVTDAASWYAKANWIGIHATPRTTILLNGLLEGEKNKRDYVMIDYRVPMTDGSVVPLKVVNWPKALFLASLVSEEVCMAPRATALTWFGRQPIPGGAEDKCFNAITFFDHIVTEQQLKPKSQSGTSKKLR